MTPVCHLDMDYHIESNCNITASFSNARPNGNNDLFNEGKNMVI